MATLRDLVIEQADEIRTIVRRHRGRTVALFGSAARGDEHEGSTAGMSLQEYLLGRLVAEATTPTIDEVLERASERAGGRAMLRDAVRAVRSDRGSR